MLGVTIKIKNKKNKKRLNKEQKISVIELE
jgi:hypothetical protein